MIEVIGIFAPCVVAVCASATIWACEYFKRYGLLADGSFLAIIYIMKGGRGDA